MIRVDLEQATHLSNRLKRVMNALDYTMAEYLNEVIDLTYDLAVEGIQGPPVSGRVYRLSHPTRIHQASAPGEYPAEDLGGLVASLEVEYATESDLNALFGSDLYYAEMLEYGTGKMAARPWMQRSFDQATFETKALLFQLWKELVAEQGAAK